MGALSVCNRLAASISVRGLASSRRRRLGGGLRCGISSEFRSPTPRQGPPRSRQRQWSNSCVIYRSRLTFLNPNVTLFSFSAVSCHFAAFLPAISVSFVSAFSVISTSLPAGARADCERVQTDARTARLLSLPYRVGSRPLGRRRVLLRKIVKQGKNRTPRVSTQILVAS